ncbi:MAG: glycosyltransferase [Gemmatimonadetes bacterium]|nr:glycosyltransferase [Gemmatimonadota bacterium]
MTTPRTAHGALSLLDITEFYSPLGGGVKTYLTAKAEWLAGQPDVSHTMVLPGERDQETTLARSRVLLLRGPRVPASPGYHFLTAGRRIREIFAEVQPDIVEIGSPFLAAVWARRAARTLLSPPALVGFYHCDARRVYVDYGLRAWPGFARNAVGTAFERYLRGLYGSFAATVAATPSAQRALERLGLRQTHLIPLGVDLETFCPERRDPAWRHAVGVRDGQPVAVYAGRFATEKRLDVVLDGLAELHRATGVKLVLIGEGHLRSHFEILARAHPEMLALLPYQPDRGALARALASADLYLAPFPLETFGLAAVEAMACGLPVVGVDSGAIADLLAEAEWGRRYRPGDPPDFVRAAHDLLGRDLRALGAKARTAAVTRYGWDQTFRALSQCYRSVWNTIGLLTAPFPGPRGRPGTLRVR